MLDVSLNTIMYDKPFKRFTISQYFGSKYRVFISEDFKKVFIFNKKAKSNLDLFSVIKLEDLDINNINIDNSVLGEKMVFNTFLNPRENLVFQSNDETLLFLNKEDISFLITTKKIFLEGLKKLKG